MADNNTSWNHTNNTNGNDPAPPGPPLSEMTAEDIAANVFFCILAAMIVFGNTLVISSFRVNRRLRTTTNLLLMSLAVADLLIGSISLPLWVYISITYSFRGNLFKFYMIFDIICGVSSILNLTAISLERCYALVSPISHRNISKRWILATIFFAWALAIFAGMMSEIKAMKNFYGITVTAVFFFLPLTIILGAYGTIFHTARAHARGVGKSSFKKDLRIATTVAVVIGLFFICWTLFFALNFAYSVCGNLMFKTAGCKGLMVLPPIVLKLSKWLQYGNSVCNPIIYGLRNKDFRRAFRKILLSLCCKKVPISDFSKSAYGRTVRSTYLQRDSKVENSRSDIIPPHMPGSGMFDTRGSYGKAIPSSRTKPIKLNFTETETLTDGLLSLNVDAFHSLSSGGSTLSSTLLSSSPSSPAELCNPAFENDQTENRIPPLDKAMPEQGFNEKLSESNHSLNKSAPNGTLQNRISRVRFTPSDSEEKDEVKKQTVSTLAPFERQRSLSEIFIRPNGETDNLQRKLRSSFSQ